MPLVFPTLCRRTNEMHKFLQITFIFTMFLLAVHVSYEPLVHHQEHCLLNRITQLVHVHVAASHASLTPNITLRRWCTLVHSVNFLPSFTIKGKQSRKKKFIFYIFVKFISSANIKKTQVQFRLTKKWIILRNERRCLKQLNIGKFSHSEWTPVSVGLRCWIN